MENEVRGRTKLSQDECRKSDSTSPDSPTHALLILGWQRATTFEQNQQDGGVNRIACQKADLGDPLRRKAEQVGKAQQCEHEHGGAEQRHGPLHFLPARFGSVVGEPQREDRKTGECGALRQRFSELLSEYGKRPAL